MISRMQELFGGPITLHQAVTSFPVPSGASQSAAGQAGFAAWKENGAFKPEDLLLRISGSAACAVGDGTYANALGVYGIKDGQADLLGIVGMDTGTGIPLVPIPGATAGFSQVIYGAAMYDDVVIGGINGTITPTNAANVTITATRIRRIEV